MFSAVLQKCLKVVLTQQMKYNASMYNEPIYPPLCMYHACVDMFCEKVVKNHRPVSKETVVPA